MFYSQDILQKRGGKFGLVWLAATRGVSLTRREYFSVSVPKTCDDIIKYVTLQAAPYREGGARPRLSLYLSSQLMYGVVKIYNRQSSYLFADCTDLTVKSFGLTTALQEIDMGPSVRNARTEIGRVDGTPTTPRRGVVDERFDPFFGDFNTPSLPRLDDIPEVEVWMMPGSPVALPQDPPITLPATPRHLRDQPAQPTTPLGNRDLRQEAKNTPPVQPFRAEFGSPCQARPENITLSDDINLNISTAQLELQMPIQEDLPPLQMPAEPQPPPADARAQSASSANISILGAPSVATASSTEYGSDGQTKKAKRRSTAKRQLETVSPPVGPDIQLPDLATLEADLGVQPIDLSALHQELRFGPVTPTAPHLEGLHEKLAAVAEERRQEEEAAIAAQEAAAGLQTDFLAAGVQAQTDQIPPPEDPTMRFDDTGARLGPMEETVAQPPQAQEEPGAPRRSQRNGPQETSMGVTPGNEPPQQKERRKRKRLNLSMELEPAPARPAKIPRRKKNRNLIVDHDITIDKRVLKLNITDGSSTSKPFELPFTKPCTVNDLFKKPGQRGYISGRLTRLWKRNTVTRHQEEEERHIWTVPSSSENPSSGSDRESPLARTLASEPELAPVGEIDEMMREIELAREEAMSRSDSHQQSLVTPGTSLLQPGSRDATLIALGDDTPHRSRSRLEDSHTSFEQQQPGEEIPGDQVLHDPDSVLNRLPTLPEEPAQDVSLHNVSLLMGSGSEQPNVSVISDPVAVEQPPNVSCIPTVDPPVDQTVDASLFVELELNPAAPPPAPEPAGLTDQTVAPTDEQAQAGGPPLILDDTENTKNTLLRIILEETRGDQTTTFRKICPPASRSRKQASKDFMLLLDLCRKSRVKTVQEDMDGGDIFITRGSNLPAHLCEQYA